MVHVQNEPVVKKLALMVVMQECHRPPRLLQHRRRRQVLLTRAK